MPSFTPTDVYDSYWRFAAKRQQMYLKRLYDPVGPWTDDPILKSYRFTNAFRAADRVSQYLIREVQYADHRSQEPSEVVFRTILFKLFNKIETWELIERQLGPVSWQSIDLDKLDKLFDAAMARGCRLYSAAYIMPAPPFGKVRKHSNHIALLSRMMQDSLPGRISQASSLHQIFELIEPYPSLGPFLAMQYSVDIAYSDVTRAEESEFVVPGPGALDGISKCFSDTGGLSPTDIIYAMVDLQEKEFADRGLEFSGLFGRRLQPIDSQNLFCEVGKYARVAHPNVKGVSGRTRIKQTYDATSRRLPAPCFPPRWNLTVPDLPTDDTPMIGSQGSLF